VTPVLSIIVLSIIVLSIIVLLIIVLRPHARTPCCVDVCPLPEPRSAGPGPAHGDVARNTTSTK
jgi:hypothetical protein